jgi:hypothetical protein
VGWLEGGLVEGAWLLRSQAHGRWDGSGNERVAGKLSSLREIENSPPFGRDVRKWEANAQIGSGLGGQVSCS